MEQLHVPCSLMLRIATPGYEWVPSPRNFDANCTCWDVSSWNWKTCCCHMLQHLWPILAATCQSSTCCLALWTVQDAASFFEVDSSTSKSTATCACPAWGVSKNISNMARNGNVIPKVGSWTLNIKTSGFHEKSFLQIRLIVVDAEKHVGTHLQHS